MPDRRDELDRLLDSALAMYGDPGPESGLEERILSRVVSEAAPAPRRRWMAWAIAVPVAAGLLFLALLAGTRQFRAPSSIQPQARNMQEPSAPDPGRLAENRAMRNEGFGKDPSGPKGRVESGRFAARINPCPFKTTGCTAPTDRSSPGINRQSRRRTFAAKSAPLPKLDVFPTPQPLSPEEQALVNFAAHATTSEREALVAAQRETDTPLSIAAIEIKPLEPPALGAN